MPIPLDSTPTTSTPATNGRNADSSPGVHQLFGAHQKTLNSLRERYGDDLAARRVDELLALQSLINDELQERSDEELSQTVTVDTDVLTPGDMSRIAEENHRRFYNFMCRVALVLEAWFASPEARGATLAHKGKKPFQHAKDFIARLNGIDQKEVERRLRIATANPTHPGASKMRAPKIERAMSQGTIDPASANYMIDRLRSIRAAARRAGATDDQADRLVETTEGEFLAKALRAGPDEVRKFADRTKRSTNRRFTEPGTRLTSRQRQFEEGLRFIAPLGDNHVRLDWVLTKWQFRHVLERLRQHINNLRSEISRLHESDDETAQARKSGAERITPADDEYEIPQLYDDRTPAQRWSHFILDILETGLVLTTMPGGKAQEHVNNQTVSEIETSTDVAEPSASTAHPEDTAPSGAHIPGLGKLVNAFPQVTVGLQYADLAGTFLDFGSDNPRVQAEIAALIEGRKPFPELYDFEDMGLDWATLRQMSCNASVIPAVLDSAGEPLDVGRSQRSFSAAIRRAVILRDGGCAYPGCKMPHIYSEVHHIQHWQDHGSTALDNAVMLCRFHHTVMHESEVLVRLGANGFPEFLRAAETPEAAWVRNYIHRG